MENQKIRMLQKSLTQTKKVIADYVCQEEQAYTKYYQCKNDLENLRGNANVKMYIEVASEYMGCCNFFEDKSDVKLTPNHVESYLERKKRCKNEMNKLLKNPDVILYIKTANMARNLVGECTNLTKNRAKFEKILQHDIKVYNKLTKDNYQM